MSWSRVWNRGERGNFTFPNPFFVCLSVCLFVCLFKGSVRNALSSLARSMSRSQISIFLSTSCLRFTTLDRSSSLLIRWNSENSTARETTLDIKDSRGRLTIDMTSALSLSSSRHRVVDSASSLTSIILTELTRSSCVIADRAWFSTRRLFGYSRRVTFYTTHDFPAVIERIEFFRMLPRTPLSLCACVCASRYLALLCL